MWKDPIVEEIHAIRAELLARFDGDFGKYCAHVRAGQGKQPALKAKSATQKLTRPSSRPVPKRTSRKAVA